MGEHEPEGGGEHGAGGGDRTRNAWEVPVSYTFGPSTVLASYTRANDFSDAANTGAKMWVIGYDYALSKRTNVGLFYGKLTNDAAANYQPYLAGTTATGSSLADAASICAQIKAQGGECFATNG